MFADFYPSFVFVIVPIWLSLVVAFGLILNNRVHHGSH